ncbi:Uncharacterised protein [Lacrimispora sphenoides]|nr:Uncharacterised protein [Lacrimispora sphenoides]
MAIALIAGTVAGTAIVPAVGTTVGMAIVLAVRKGIVKICLIGQAEEKKNHYPSVLYHVNAEVVSFWTCHMKNSWNRNRNILKNC